MLSKSFVQKVIGPYTRCMDDNQGGEYICALAEYCCDDGCCADKLLDNKTFLGGTLCLLIIASVLLLWCYYKKQGIGPTSETKEIQRLCESPIRSRQELVVDVKKDTRLDMEVQASEMIPEPVILAKQEHTFLSKINLFFQRYFSFERK